MEEIYPMMAVPTWKLSFKSHDAVSNKELSEHYLPYGFLIISSSTFDISVHHNNTGSYAGHPQSQTCSHKLTVTKTKLIELKKHFQNLEIKWNII